MWPIFTLIVPLLMVDGCLGRMWDFGGVWVYGGVSADNNKSGMEGVKKMKKKKENEMDTKEEKLQVRKYERKMKE